MWWSLMSFAALFLEVLYSRVLSHPPHLPHPSPACSAAVLNMGNAFASLIQLVGKGQRHAGSSYNNLPRLGTNVQQKPKDNVLQCSYQNKQCRLSELWYMIAQLEQKIRRGGKASPSLFGHLPVKFCQLGILFPPYLLPSLFTVACKSDEWSPVNPLFLNIYNFLLKWLLDVNMKEYSALGKFGGIIYVFFSSSQWFLK